ncbi:MAG: tRNA pseudouridine(55) synthase TruB, partial [Nevskiales bacterium]
GVDALDDKLLPMSQALSHWPEVTLDASSCFYFQRGQAVQVANTAISGLLRVNDEAGVFIGIGEIDAEGRVAPKRLFKD